MKKKTNAVYDRNTVEFVTVALEYCTFVEKASQMEVFDFVDKATKILPLLYLKAALLPEVEVDDMFDPELYVTESMYDAVRTGVASLLGEHDTYLDTFRPDMAYSETPIAAFISEDLADVYQDVGNFVSLFRQGNEEVMQEAVALCRTNFCNYWGQRLLNALKALHDLRYSDDELRTRKTRTGPWLTWNDIPYWVLIRRHVRTSEGDEGTRLPWCNSRQKIHVSSSG